MIQELVLLVLYLLVWACDAVAVSVSLDLFAEMAPQKDMEHVVLAVVAGLAVFFAVGFTGGGST